MHLALLALTLQLGLNAQAVSRPQGHVSRSVADSIRDRRAALSAQSSFERARRYSLPEGGGLAGRCDVHLGRFCWTFNDYQPTFPPEAAQISHRIIPAGFAISAGLYEANVSFIIFVQSGRTRSLEKAPR